MRKLTLAAVAAVSAHANSRAEPKPNAIPRVFAPELTAINACVQEVRLGTRPATFDAYVDVRGKMRYVGTQGQIQAFKDCIQKQGTRVD